MVAGFVVRKAVPPDAPKVDVLLSEWFDWRPKSGRLGSIHRAIRSDELLVAQTTSEIIGFIHYILHEDIIDGGPNSFISAFFVSQRFRDKGVGSLLLDAAISDSLARGAVGVETSTIHAHAREFYQKRRFKQTFGDIGEIFLELDIAEYLRTKQNVGV